MPSTAIITGGSRGIGAACACALAAAGYAVVIGYCTNESAAAAVRDRIRSNGGEASVFRADVSVPSDADSLMNYTYSTYGRVDVLVNSAGVSHFSLANETADADWRRVFAVNVDGVFHTCCAVLPAMIARKEGCIINIGSMWGEVGAACETAYSASKAAVMGYTKALAKEVGPSGVRVNCISPGLIETDMNAQLTVQEKQAVIAETPLGRIGSPDDVARLAVFLAQDRFMTGQVIGINGGLVI